MQQLETMPDVTRLVLEVKHMFNIFEHDMMTGVAMSEVVCNATCYFNQSTHNTDVTYGTMPVHGKKVR